MSGQRKESWLLSKRRDGHADPARDVVAEEPGSVVSGLTIEEVSGGET
jgi:bifunctional non-homologous end joining protein LigD